MTAQPIARLLLEWRSGNEQALEQLSPLVYEELRNRGAAARRSPFEKAEAAAADPRKASLSISRELKGGATA
jgi:hypothetical protein